MLKAAVIGTSFGASFHAPAYQNHPEFELVGIAGNNFDKTRQKAETLGIEAIVDWKSIIENPEIDVVSVATPPYLHHKMASEAIKAGKHVLLEKPTAMNAQEAYDLHKLADQNNVKGMICHEWRYYQMNQFIHNFIHVEKKLGVIELFRGQDLLTFTYNQPYSWVYDGKLGGGWLGVAGSHVFDLTRYIIQDEIETLQGFAGIRDKTRKDRNGKIQEVTAEDYFSAIFTTKTGINGIIDHIPSLKPSPPSRVIISGTEGTLYTEGFNFLIPKNIFFAKHGENYEKIQPKEIRHDVAAGTGSIMHDAFQLLLDDLVVSIQTGKIVHPNLDDGWKNQLILDKIKESGKSGKRVVVQLT